MHEQEKTMSEFMQSRNPLICILVPRTRYEEAVGQCMTSIYDMIQMDREEKIAKRQ